MANAMALYDGALFDFITLLGTSSGMPLL